MANVNINAVLEEDRRRYQTKLFDRVRVPTLNTKTDGTLSTRILEECMRNMAVNKNMKYILVFILSLDWYYNSCLKTFYCAYANKIQ